MTVIDAVVHNEELLHTVYVAVAAPKKLADGVNVTVVPLVVHVPLEPLTPVTVKALPKASVSLDNTAIVVL